MNATKLAILLAGGALIIAGCEYFLGTPPQTALLLNLAFWISIFHGCVALVAAAELAQGKWILPVKRGLLSLTPMILLCAVLFLLMGRHWDIYPFGDKESVWFAKNFYVLRNFILLAISYLAALQYGKQSLANSEHKETYAVLYLFAFVVTQSMVAFDWIMPLEYPWFSTLLGGYFFVECLYAGLAFSAFFCLFLKPKDRQAPQYQPWTRALYDTGVMLFGFSVLWGGLFFAQLIVIWYGNIPEEIMPFTRRLALTSYKVIGIVTLVLMFLVPFCTLLLQKSKKNAYVVSLVALLILGGIFLERYFFIVPVAQLSHLTFVVQFLVIAILVAIIVKKNTVNE